MKFLVLAMTALLMQSCAWRSSQSEETVLLNNSALYDPPTVTLIEGQEYQFNEGVVTGRGQIFHSHYSYMRAIVIGK